MNFLQILNLSYIESSEKCSLVPPIHHDMNNFQKFELLFVFKDEIDINANQKSICAIYIRNVKTGFS